MYTLSDFDHLRSNKAVRFKQELINGETVTIVTYMVSDPDLWEQRMGLETRGIAFDQSGRCICLPLHKFFNVNERETTQLGRLSFDGARYYTKRDGSMVTPVMFKDGSIRWKTKRSFTADVAVRVESVVPSNVVEFSREALNNNITPIFEFTDSSNKIVIDYGNQPKFVLLALRRIDDGEYLDYDTWAPKAKQTYNIECIDQIVGKTHIDLIRELETAENIEGYVIQHANGTWTKLKSKWYLARHRTMTDLREKDIALAVINDWIDDLKANVVNLGLDPTPLCEIEKSVVHQLENIQEKAGDLCDKIKQIPVRKQAVLTYSKHPYFNLAMALYDNKEPNIIRFWKYHYLSQYSQRVVYNLNF